MDASGFVLGRNISPLVARQAGHRHLDGLAGIAFLLAFLLSIDILNVR
jgi:hypothetical protein